MNSMFGPGQITLDLSSNNITMLEAYSIQTMASPLTVSFANNSVHTIAPNALVCCCCALPYPAGMYVSHICLCSYWR